MAQQKTIVAEGQSTNRPSLFDGSNYPYWSTRMSIYIRAIDYEMWDVITDGPFMPLTVNVVTNELMPKPRSEWTEAETKKVQVNFKAINRLHCTLTPTEFNKVSSCTTAKQVWEKLRIIHEGTFQVKESKIAILTYSYEMFKMERGEDITSMFDRFQSQPKESHLTAIKKIFRYLIDTQELGIWYFRNSTLNLVGYSDADFAGSRTDRKSTSGTCQFLERMLVSWSSKKQNSVALSTAEAKYVSLGYSTFKNRSYSPSLVKEFYSGIALKEKELVEFDDYVEDGLNVYLNGKEFIVTAGDFGNLLKLEGEIRILHYFIAANIQGRSGSLSYISLQDLWLMEHAFNGVSLNLERFMIEKMRSAYRLDKVNPSYGNVITSLVQKKGIWAKRYDMDLVKTRDQAIYYGSLIKMGFSNEMIFNLLIRIDGKLTDQGVNLQKMEDKITELENKLKEKENMGSEPVATDSFAISSTAPTQQGAKGLVELAEKFASFDTQAEGSTYKFASPNLQTEDSPQGVEQLDKSPSPKPQSKNNLE
ncbi:hypothetical protein QQP08_021645 [Theobroma cacao]|nr:hypothetical protein QQP08_021645 [Theobroma cacao]